MKTIKRIYDFFARPFKEDFIFLFIMAILVCGPRFVHHSFLQYQGLSMLVWEVAHSYLLCYFVALVTQIIPIRFKKAYIILFIVLAFVDFCIDTACIMVTHNPFYVDHVAIVMGTNLSEGREFINTYFTTSLLWGILAILAVVWLLLRSTKVINFLGRKIAFIATLFSVCSCIFFVSKGSNTWECRFYNKIFALMSFEMPPDLKPYQDKLDVNLSKSDMPDNVILILGESFSKSHSSLYGYDKDTNPYLTILENDSLLVTYENVIAPGLHTIDCIKSIMSTYKLEYKDSVNWYECITLPNLMKHIGYSTMWISNQSPSGAFDNIAARYSELCDSVIFVGNTMKGVRKTDFDEEIIPKLQSIISADKNFIIVHLMGSHVAYKKRYPEEWNIFRSNDYPDLIDSQRATIASYDNSILYNDYVVSNILKCFESKETLALYFSDHGQDLFNSSEDYYGHALAGNVMSEAAAIKIPFFVYMSREFQENFPKETDWVKSKRTEKFNTENTMDFLWQILSINSKYNKQLCN